MYPTKTFNFKFVMDKVIKEYENIKMLKKTE